MEIYKSIASLEREKSMIGYVRPLRRAWDTFSLDLVLCVDGTPTLFFAERKKVMGL